MRFLKRIKKIDAFTLYGYFLFYCFTACTAFLAAAIGGGWFYLRPIASVNSCDGQLQLLLRESNHVSVFLHKDPRSSSTSHHAITWKVSIESVGGSGVFNIYEANPELCTAVNAAWLRLEAFNAYVKE